MSSDVAAASAALPPAAEPAVIQDPTVRDRNLREIALRFSYLRRVVLTELTQKLAPLGVTPPTYHLLFRLKHDGELPQQDLVADSGLDAAGVSRLIAKIGKEGLVATRVDPNDRRRRIVKLTDKGRRLEESLAPVVDAAIRNVVPGLEEHEEAQLLSLLDKAVAGAVALQRAREQG
ncbi:MAG: transcriptional regulator SlyA [Sandaracinaceae bacterium]